MNERVYLTVAYAEKDQAKALGARWDALARRWFVPEGLAVESFHRWLPTSLPPKPSDSISFMVAESDTSTMTPSAQGLRLSELMSQANRALQLALPKAVWVVAEITELGQRQGHVYLTLAESAQGQQLAQVKATIWSSHRDRLFSAFEQVTGQQIAAGMSVLLSVELSIHARFGLSLNVVDMNPSYTLGDQEAKLQQIRAQLKTQGLWSLNKQKQLSRDFARIAVLAPAQAAGLGDFRSDANQLTAVGLCEFDYYHASFQGVSAVAELTQALTQIKQANEQSAYDALVIIRGGGAKQDLMFLNELSLATAVCRFPIPVLTGIGHERDSTILDEVAFARFDTPSKSIAFIRQHIVDAAHSANAAWQSIQQTASWQLQQARTAINEHQNRIQQRSHQHLYRAKQQLIGYWHTCEQSARLSLKAQAQQLNHWQTQLSWSAQHHCQGHKQQLTQWQAWMLPAAQQQLNQQHQGLNHFHQLIQSMHPKRLLAQGYLLARNEAGQVVSSAEEAAKLAHFSLTFSDGSLTVNPEPPSLTLLHEAD